ncbi:hypothetical protein [Bradyrhizobium valentinum]|nr:hypothetical protein [Bradyrhizobium valentinum]
MDELAQAWNLHVSPEVIGDLRRRELSRKQYASDQREIIKKVRKTLKF